MEISNRYMEFILYVVLQVEKGDSLTINSSSENLEFATKLGQKCAEITQMASQVVIVDKGKVGEVIPLKPLENSELSTTPTVQILLRIDDFKTKIDDDNLTVEQILNSAPLLQHYNTLAPPQLNRPIAPWAVIPLPNFSWAKELYNDEKLVDKVWSEFATLLELDSDNWLDHWNEKLQLAQSRLRSLNRLDCDHYKIVGDNINLRCKKLDFSRWQSGLSTLENGRTYIPYLNLNRYSILLDRDSTVGEFQINDDFKLLNQVVSKATIKVFDGEVVGVDALKGKEVLAKVVSCDDGSSHLSELSLVEEPLEIIKSTYLGFDEAKRNSVVFGMGDSSHIEALETYDDENQLQQLTGCNISLVRIRVPLEGSLDVIGCYEDGNEIKIMENGQIIA